MELVMKSRNSIKLALVGMMATATWGTALGQTATNPALPQGHPTVPAQNSSALPAGHPSLPQQNPGGSLPAGHPQVEGASTRPAAQFGTLILRTYQGTQGGPALGEDPVTVEFYYKGALVHKDAGKLDTSGTTVFQKVPLATPCQPLIKVKHAGIEYAAIGDILHGYHASETVEMNVYEVTDKQPQWAVQARHLMIDPTPQGLNVIEMIAFQNPTDRSWLGNSRPDGTKATFSIDLPANATNVRLDGPSDGIKVDKNSIVAVTPMQPGVCQLQITYNVPAGVDGKVVLPIVNPTAVSRLMCFINENGSTATAEGLVSGGAQAMPNGAKTLMFTGHDLKVGQKATLTVVLPKPAKASSENAPGSNSVYFAKVVAAVGSGIVLVAGTGYVLFRPAATANAPKGRA
jgi:hypothetical protein